MRVRLQHGEHQMRQGGQPGFPEQGPELALQQILLVRAEIET